jgi:hypothetical protein
VTAIALAPTPLLQELLAWLLLLLLLPAASSFPAGMQLLILSLRCAAAFMQLTSSENSCLAAAPITAGSALARLSLLPLLLLLSLAAVSPAVKLLTAATSTPIHVVRASLAGCACRVNRSAASKL